MNKLLRCCCLLLALGLLVARPAHASHIVGGDMTYRSLGSNRYEVSVTYFRDCTGIALPTTLNLTCRNGNGCTGGTALNTTLIAVGAATISNPYCGAVQTTFVCSPTSLLPGYQLLSYRGTVTLPPGYWTWSVDDCCRPSTALTLQVRAPFVSKPPSTIAPGSLIPRRLSANQHFLPCPGSALPLPKWVLSMPMAIRWFIRLTGHWNPAELTQHISYILPQLVRRFR